MLFIDKNISYLRKKHQFSQVGLADLLGVKRNTISNYENGISTPDYETLIQLAKIFDVSIEELITADLSNTRGESAASPLASNSGYGSGDADQKFVKILSKIEEEISSIKRMLKKLNKE